MFEKKKKIIILLIDNPITALFMLGWLKQNNLDKDDNYEIVSFYCTIDYDDSYSKKIDSKKTIYENNCKRIMSPIQTKWISCSEPGYYIDRFSLTPFSFYKLNQERKLKKLYLHKIKTALKTKNISMQNIQQVWRGTSGFGSFFRYLCPRAEFSKFEHGLSDTCINTPEPLFPKNLSLPKKTNRKIYWWIYNHLAYFNFSYLNYEFDSYISLLGEERKKTTPAYENSIKSIKLSFIHKALSIVNKQFNLSLLQKNISGASAVILLHNIKPWAKNPNDHLLFFQAFEKHLINSYSKIFRQNQIKTLIFKSRLFHEEFNKEGFNNFSQLKKEYYLLFLSDLSKENLPTEFYLDTIKPVVLIGDYSSGLFYSKKLYPNIKTYSYHPWFINYTTQTFDATFPDHSWLEKTFHGVLQNEFKHILPTIISTQTNKPKQT
ncbi:alpha-2,8-polysialyltransferase family protein [Candidatus Dependentiae bacterium]|nr:alpha-2,8-polysialyltransferase family protein [Candidatus Dependentiae bacterium]